MEKVIPKFQTPVAPQGWAQPLKAVLFCRGRELEAEERQTKFEERPRRGDPMKKPSYPSYSSAVPNLVALSQTVRQRVNGRVRRVAPPSWIEVIYVIPKDVRYILGYLTSLVIPL